MWCGSLGNKCLRLSLLQLHHSWRAALMVMALWHEEGGMSPIEGALEYEDKYKYVHKAWMYCKLCWWFCHYPNQCWHRSIMSYIISRPQWVNFYFQRNLEDICIKIIRWKFYSAFIMLSKCLLQNFALVKRMCFHDTCKMFGDLMAKTPLLMDIDLS